MNQQCFYSRNVINRLQQKYNIFSPKGQIMIKNENKIPKKPRKEMKLLFHHHHLLYLNKHNSTNKETQYKYIQHNMISDIQKRKQSYKYNNNYKNVIHLVTTLDGNLPNKQQNQRRKQKHQTSQMVKEQNNLQLSVRCQTQQNLTNTVTKRNAKTDYMHKRLKSNQADRNKSYSYGVCTQLYGEHHMFDQLQQNECPRQKNSALGRLINTATSKHKVRLNMYIAMESRYRRYMGKPMGKYTTYTTYTKYNYLATQ